MASSKQRLVLRSVTEGDCYLLWTWANDADVRASAFSQAPIPLDDHERWFSRRLSDANTLMFIAEDEAGAPIGQVRFDVGERGEAEIDFSVAKDKRGRGYGPAILEAGTARLFEASPVSVVRATVKDSNSASCRSFQAAGFTDAVRDSVHGSSVIVFKLRRHPSA